jgi:hypothetical protein
MDAWVYIDESQAPHAAGADHGQPFWLGAVITEHPIEQSLTAAALDQLKADPEAVGNAQDTATLARGYFHASEDSKNAHSWVCRAIVDAPLDASFSATQWFFGRRDSDQYGGGQLHRLTALLSALTVIEDDFDTVHIFVASREGSFEQKHMDEWPTYCTKIQLGALIGMPALPTRFPRLNAQLVPASHAGVQVCDFVLWAVQRSKLDGLNPTGKSDWMKRLKLNLWAAGGAKDRAQQGLHGELGRGADRPIFQPLDSPPPRQLHTLNEIDRWVLAQQIANDVHHAAAIAEGNHRIGHLASIIHRASVGCETAHERPTNQLGEALSAMMEAFLLVCNTLPVFDVADGAAWARATEKRFLAAAFMKQEIPLLLSKGFSLRAQDVARSAAG